MMASPSELSLECKPHSYSMLLKSVADQQQQQPSDQTQKLEEFLARLEEERLKIDAFKRELPLCMQLLTNAMEASRQQLQSYRVVKPVLEEFIPLKHIPIMCEEGSDKKKAIITTNNNNACSDKANWMTSAQLWSDQAAQPGHEGQDEEQEEEETKKHPLAILTSSSHSNNNNKKLEASGLMGFGVNLKQAFENNKQRNGGSNTTGGGAFLPFNSKERNSSSKLVIPELALASSSPPDHHDKDTEENKKNLESSCMMMNQQVKGQVAGDSQTNATTNNNNNNNNNNTTTNQTHRKARRCWSPDLHRRFVNALQMLGGSQVATPKQIRELMKVDGLTNDEVKSHLQKYRLHTRRPSPSPQAAAAAAPQLVVLGGIWVPSEYATAAAAAHHGGATPALYGAHHASSPHHYCATPVPQEFYPTTAPPPPPPATQATAHHHHHHHHQLHHHSLHNQLHHHVYHPASQTTVHSSPESDIRGGTAAGDRSESIEDGKSESSSWKADDSNGENGGERKILALRGEDGEESNGSDITLKF